MKRRDPQTIGRIIADAVQAGNMSDNFDLQRASSLWPEIVGPEINRRTMRRYVDGTTLHVYIISAPLRQELSYHRTRLVELLNAAVGRDVLTDIRFH